MSENQTPSPVTETPSPQEGSSSPEAQGSENPVKTQTQTAEELYELVVNGKKRQFNRQEMLSRAQQAESATQRYSEAAQIRKEAAQAEQRIQQILANAKKNPIQALMDPALGLTKDQIREHFETWYNQEFIEPETLSPEQRKYKEAQVRLKQYEEQEKAMREKEETQQREQLTAKERERFQNQIIQAMEEGKLPKNAWLASRVAFYMRENLVNGWEAPLDVVIQHVKKEHQGLLRNSTSSASAEQIIDLLGDDIVNKIRKYDLERLRAKRAPKPATPLSQDLSPTNKTGQRPSMSDVNENLKRLRREGW